MAFGHWHCPRKVPIWLQLPVEVQTSSTSLPQAWNMPPQPWHSVPQDCPAGFRVQPREVPVGAPAMQAPAALQVLLVTLPASVPERAQGWFTGGVQLPLQVVVEPQAMPLGLKGQAREVPEPPPAMHWPLELQTLLVMVPASEPVVAQPPPTWVHMPVHVVLEPQAMPAGS